MKRQLLIKTLYLLTLITFSTNSSAQHHHDSPSVHGMLLFGKEVIYLSHLPMFHNPHNYQVLLEVEMSPKAMLTYTQALKNYPNETVYTIVPEVFSLPKLKDELKVFKAQVYKGHFERGGQAITKSIEFKVKSVLLFKELHDGTTKPIDSKQTLIGNKFEQYLIHQINSVPDFDQVTKVVIEDLETLEELEKAKIIPLTLMHPNDEPLTQETLYSGTLHSKKPKQVSIQSLSSLYLEFGDLSF